MRGEHPSPEALHNLPIDRPWESGRGGSGGRAPYPFRTPAHCSSLHPSDAPSRPWSPLTFSPARLTVPEGANATFTCSFSSKPEHFVLNWYRMSPSNQTDKLAAFPEDRSQPGRDRRFHVTPLPGGRHFHMSIMAAQRNDSGVYFCGAIYLPPKTQINESRPAELTVTGEGVGDPRAWVSRAGSGQPAGAASAMGHRGQGLPGSIPGLCPTPRTTATHGPGSACLEAPPDPLVLEEEAGGRRLSG